MGRERREEEDPIPVTDPTQVGGNIPTEPVEEGEEYEGDAEEDDQDDDNDDGEEDGDEEDDKE